MILLIDTSTPVCRVTLVIADEKKEHAWEAGRGLAKGLLRYLYDVMSENDKTWSDIKGIGVFEGPGSFTGLRIGMTVANTIANAQDISIVGSRGENWKDISIKRLSLGENDIIVLPFYGSEANITTPKK